MDKKQEPTTCCLQETHFRAKDTHGFKVRGWKKIFHANGNDKKAGIAILIPDKIDFKTNSIKKGKEGHYIMIRGSIQEEDITLINTYAPNIGAPKYIKQIPTDIKGETEEYNNSRKLYLTYHLYQWTDLPDRKLIRQERS